MRQRDYRTAYGMLSASVRRDIRYQDFADRSDDIKSFQLLTLRLLERSGNVARFYVKGKLRLVYQGELFLATYGGRATLTRHDGRWRVEEVELKPLSQKRLGKAYHVGP